MRFNLHQKITLIITSIIALILIGLYILLNKDLTEHTYQRIHTDLLKKTSFSQTYLQQVYEPGLSLIAYDKIADTIGEDLDLRVTIISNAGEVLGDSQLDASVLAQIENHFHRPEIQQALRDGMGQAQRFSTTMQQDMLYVVHSFGRRNHDGFIRLSIPLSDINLISNNLKKLLIMSLVFAFAFAIVFSLGASLLISRPIKEIASASNAIANGNFLRKINVQSHDEIGNLSRSINYMSEQIKMRMDEVLLSKSRLEAVLLSMFEGMMVVDTQGSILLMNKTLRGFLNVEDDPIGKRPIEMIRNVEIQELTDQVLAARKGVKSKELSVFLPEEKVLLVHATPVIREGETDGAVLVFHDITELRRLEKIRQDFVANVSHELRTPVATIKGYAETLLGGALDDKENAKDFIKIIYSDSDRLAKLVNDLLDLSRIESDKLQLVLQESSIAAILSRIKPLILKQAEDNSITIQESIPKDLPKVKIDETGVAQVLLNFIENAIKYNSEHGSVTISAQDIGGCIQVSIKDTGIGIPEEDLPRIFERFYRVDKARSRELGGTGLGLSIVKHIVQAHGGDVSVESKLDQGTTFFFTLPKA